MSKAVKLSAAKPADASYWKTTAVIIAVLLLLAVASLLFNQAYSANRGVAAQPFAMGITIKMKQSPMSGRNSSTWGIYGQHEPRGWQSEPANIDLTQADQTWTRRKNQGKHPEIQHHVNMVLQSKRSSELLTYEDKEKLAQQIKQHVEYVIGFRKTAPIIGSAQIDAAPTIRKNGISDVLFTSFIIQY